MCKIGHNSIHYNIPEPFNYAAYLYKITVLSTGKFYIGWHAGEADGSYWHSSECPKFAKDFALGNNKYEILDFGTKSDMATEEHIMLKEVDAKNNDGYYNLSNGGGKYVIGMTNDIEEFYDSIVAGDLDEFIRDLKVSLLKGLSTFQVRAFNQESHIRYIKQVVDDAMGNTEGLLVHVLEGYDNGKDKVLNGNHSIAGVSRSKHGKNGTLRTMVIPKEIWSKFDEDDLETLALLLNPRDKARKLETDKFDAEKRLVSRKMKKNIDVDSKVNKEFLSRRFYFTKAEIKTIIKNASREVNKKTNTMMGKVWIDWTAEPHKDSLEATLEDARDKATIAMSMSSGNFSWDHIIKKLYASPKKKNLIIYIHHPQPTTINYEDNWFANALSYHNGQIDLILRKNGWNVKLEYMTTLEKNGLNTEEEAEEEDES